jgi:H+/Cl- antiporter ClcA
MVLLRRAEMSSVDVEAMHRGGDRARSLGSRLPPGALALLAAAGSLVACYGTLFVAMVLGVEMTGWRAHLQALVMWGLGAVVLYALWTERREHGSSIPLAVMA